MPHPSGLLTSFARRDSIDKVLFGWVRGITRTLPGVSVEKALALFAKEFDLKPDEFNILSQEKRYQRMVKEFWADKRTDHVTRKPENEGDRAT